MSEPFLEASGWERVGHEAQDFTERAGPFWMRGDGVDREFGFIVERWHANEKLTLHGGMITTLADVALGAAVSVAAQAIASTVQLQVQFIAAGRVGNFVSCAPQIVRLGSSLVFVRGDVLVHDKIIASASGVWKILKQR
jgi:acyl-coenzyme A thioesterase PaaI-like protein